jgi:hypothetical protein
MTTAAPLARYGAMGKARVASGSATAGSYTTSGDTIRPGWGRAIMSDVFISYARSTEKQAQAVAEALRTPWQ